MKISVKQYAQALLELSRDKKGADLSKTIKDFIRILVEHNQTSKIDRIINSFTNLWDKENNFVNAEIVSANKLSAEVSGLLEKYIKDVSKAKDINIESRIDESILGGVVIRYSDHIFDASLRTKVQALKANIIN